MRIHFVVPNFKQQQRFSEPLHWTRGLLVSYAFGDELVDDAVTSYPRQKLIVDSGAFSAFHSGVEIDIRQYGLKAAKLIEVGVTCVSLDVIGNPALTWRNYKKLKSMGVAVRPVITSGTTRDQIKRAIEADGGSEAYLFFGGLGLPGAISWLDRTYSWLLDYGLVRTHLFGRSEIKYLSRYPAYTCDSTTWLSPILWGNVPARFRPDGRTATWSLRREDGKILVDACRKAVRDGLRLEEQMTELWRRRGVAWQD